MPETIEVHELRTLYFLHGLILFWSPSVLLDRRLDGC